MKPSMGAYMPRAGACAFVMSSCKRKKGNGKRGPREFKVLNLHVACRGGRVVEWQVYIVAE
jgi:hypothetical protein